MKRADEVIGGFPTVLGSVIEVQGVTLRIAQAKKGKYDKGYLYIVATEDGEEAALHKDCKAPCESFAARGALQRVAVVAAYDTVTETRYLICSECRGIIKQ